MCFAMCAARRYGRGNFQIIVRNGRNAIVPKIKKFPTPKNSPKKRRRPKEVPATLICKCSRTCNRIVVVRKPLWVKLTWQRFWESEETIDAMFALEEGFNITTIFNALTIG